jgi:putative hydrolase of the HAD superfamily
LLGQALVSGPKEGETVATEAKCAIFFDVSGTLLRTHPSRLFGYEVFDDALSVLHKCRKRFFAGHHVVTGAITNWGDHVNSLFKSLKMEDCFDVVVHADSFGVLKPQRRVFENACAMANLRVENCIHVGDSLFHDALGAQRSGMHGIWLERDHRVFHGMSERDLIASLNHEPISSLLELEGICELIFSTLQRTPTHND